MPISRTIAATMRNASWIRRMFETGNELRAKFGPENVYDFTLGNPTTEPPERFGEVLRELVNVPMKGAHRYMSNNGFLETREAVAQSLSKDMEGTVPATNVVMSVGAAGALNITLKAILDPGDEVIFLAPYFPEYRFYIENHQGLPRVAQTREDFSLDLDSIAELLTSRTKAIIINTPNNPTGVIYSRADLEALERLLESHRERTGKVVYVISDEPYRKLVYDAAAIPQTLDILSNAIMCTSHSKDLGLPGERIGFAAVSPRCVDAGELVSGMVFCNRTLGYVNAPALMQRVVAHLQDETVDMADYKAKRDLFYEGLQRAGYTLGRPGGAFYLFVKTPEGHTDVEFVNRLLGYRILAVPGSGFGREGWFRLSYCVDQKTIEHAIPLFAEALSGN